MKGQEKAIRKMVLGLLLVVAIALVGCSSSDNEVVAKVNDEVITKDDLYEILVANSGEQVLESLISEMVIGQEAKKAGAEVSEEEIQADLENMIESYGGEDSFNEALAYYGYKRDDIIKNITINRQVKKLMEPGIEITDEDVEAYFAENKDSMGTEEEISAKHILVKDEDLAKEIYEKLQNGEDFEEMAREHSEDGSAASGGDLGYFGKGQMVKEFEEAAFSLAVGQISEPVESEFGFHIIMLVDRIEGVEADLENSREEIKEILLDEKISSGFDEWFSGVLANYTIENNLTK